VCPIFFIKSSSISPKAYQNYWKLPRRSFIFRAIIKLNWKSLGSDFLCVFDPMDFQPQSINIARSWQSNAPIISLYIAERRRHQFSSLPLVISYFNARLTLSIELLQGNPPTNRAPSKYSTLRNLIPIPPSDGFPVSQIALPHAEICTRHLHLLFERRRASRRAQLPHHPTPSHTIPYSTLRLPVFFKFPVPPYALTSTVLCLYWLHYSRSKQGLHNRLSFTCNMRITIPNLTQRRLINILLSCKALRFLRYVAFLLQ
jgi:hypothetical protein